MLSKADLHNPSEGTLVVVVAALIERRLVAVVVFKPMQWSVPSFFPSAVTCNCWRQVTDLCSFSSRQLLRKPFEPVLDATVFVKSWC